MNTPNTNDAPLRIPRDLNPGDKLWFSETQYATVRPGIFGFLYDEDSIRAVYGAKAHIYSLHDGHEFFRDTPPIIRVERVTSAERKPKPKPGKKQWAVVYWCPTRTGARALKRYFDAHHPQCDKASVRAIHRKAIA